MRFHERGTQEVRIVGMLFDYVSTTPPDTKTLYCDGSLVSKTVYPLLWARCGVLYGIDTPTHFRIPDCRGRGRVGYLAGDADFDPVGATGGAKTDAIANHVVTQPNDHGHHHHATADHTLTAGESGLPDHTHSVGNLNYSTNPAASNIVASLDGLTHEQSVTGGAQNAASAHSHGDTGNEDGTLTHAGATVNAHETIQVLDPFISIPVMIVALP